MTKNQLETLETNSVVTGIKNLIDNLNNRLDTKRESMNLGIVLKNYPKCSTERPKSKYTRDIQRHSG